jgi:anti-sigma factor RsiW
MVELITDYLEGALTRSQRRRFEAHLAGCEHCSEYLEQMRVDDPPDRPPARAGPDAADARGVHRAVPRWRAEEE